MSVEYAGNPYGRFVTGSPTFPHPNEMTATQLPQTVFPGTKSQWEGCDRYDFKFQDRDAIVVVPKKAAPGRPWIWRPAFFGAFPSVDQALLKEGFHIVYYDLHTCMEVRMELSWEMTSMPKW